MCQQRIYWPKYILRHLSHYQLQLFDNGGGGDQLNMHFQSNIKHLKSQVTQLSGWNLFPEINLNCSSAVQPQALKWTMHVYRGWCCLCSGRVCSLRPLRADRSQKKAAKCRGLVAPKRAGRGQFSVHNVCSFIAYIWQKAVPVLHHRVLLHILVILSAVLIVSNCLKPLHPETCWAVQTSLVFVTRGSFSQWWFSHFLTHQHCFSTLAQWGMV